MNLRAMTVNLGGGGPTAMNYKAKADKWAEHVRQNRIKKGISKMTICLMLR